MSELVFLGGAIRHWWEADTEAEVEEARSYFAWRREVRQAVVDAGYLTYAPWEAMKGPWNDVFQAINEAAIRDSSVFLVLSPADVPAEGTKAEVAYCKKHRVPVLQAWDRFGLRAAINWLGVVA